MASLYPFRGRSKNLTAVFSRFRSATWGTPEKRVSTFAFALATIAVLTAIALVHAGFTVGNAAVVLVLAVVAAIAERGTVLLGRDTEQSISLVPTLFAAVLFGPLASMVVATASMVGDFT